MIWLLRGEVGAKTSDDRVNDTSRKNLPHLKHFILLNANNRIKKRIKVYMTYFKQQSLTFTKK